jgi:2-polyprenyl-6-methoxyphenol hydroxylase-like FAD-dependent oxidoreductase
MTQETTDVAIVGGGPAGLMLALELGARGVACTLLEEDATPPAFPKANATSARTMDHYRRHGFANLVRASGLPDDRPQDVVYCTRGDGHELARFRIPSPSRARAGLDHGDYGAERWPTPELPHRGQQMFIEPILLDQVRRHPSVRLHLGTHVTGLRVNEQFVELDAGTLRLQARYVVGCDGARSLVREAMGVAYSGRGREEREFFGGQMLTIYFRSARLASVLRLDRAWTYWIVNPEQRGVLIAIDGHDVWAAGIQLKPGLTPDDIDVAAVLTALVGRPFEFELLNKGAWLAGHMLVADRWRVGRCLIAGDAAHLFTPAAGMGYNTSIDDAVNLGWKLAAVLQGWAPESLLQSYEAERRPIAQRNTRFAKQMADSMSTLSSPPDLEQGDAAGESARAALGARCLAHIRTEFNIPGLQLGVRYASAIVAREDGPPPADEPNVYVPSAYPGARAPHAGDASEGGSILDRLGMGFSLLCLDGAPVQHSAAWENEARQLGIPLVVVTRDDAALRALYGAERVLVRPDHHVAWRGDAASAPRPVLLRATGRIE